MSSYLVKTNTSKKKKTSIGFYVSKLAGALLEKTPAGELGPRSSSPKSPRPRQKPDGNGEHLGTERTGQRRVFVTPPTWTFWRQDCQSSVACDASPGCGSRTAN